MCSRLRKISSLHKDPFLNIVQPKISVGDVEKRIQNLGGLNRVTLAAGSTPYLSKFLPNNDWNPILSHLESVVILNWKAGLFSTQKLSLSTDREPVTLLGQHGSHYTFVQRNKLVVINMIETFGWGYFCVSPWLDSEKITQFQFGELYTVAVTDDKKIYWVSTEELIKDKASATFKTYGIDDELRILTMILKACFLILTLNSQQSLSLDLEDGSVKKKYLSGSLQNGAVSAVFFNNDDLYLGTNKGVVIRHQNQKVIPLFNEKRSISSGVFIDKYFICSAENRIKIVKISDLEEKKPPIYGEFRHMSPIKSFKVVKPCNFQSDIFVVSIAENATIWHFNDQSVFQSPIVEFKNLNPHSLLADRFGILIVNSMEEILQIWFTGEHLGKEGSIVEMPTFISRIIQHVKTSDLGVALHDGNLSKIAEIGKNCVDFSSNK